MATILIGLYWISVKFSEILIELYVCFILSFSMNLLVQFAENVNNQNTNELYEPTNW